MQLELLSNSRAARTAIDLAKVLWYGLGLGVGLGLGLAMAVLAARQFDGSSMVLLPWIIEFLRALLPMLLL